MAYVLFFKYWLCKLCAAGKVIYTCFSQNVFAGGPMRGNKQPDWLCRDTGNKNFGWREVCNRCQVIDHNFC